MPARPDWDDERIGSAFRARAGRTAPPPADLGEAVLERLERGRMPIGRLGRLPAGAAAVLLVGIVGLLAALGVRPSARPATSSPVTGDLHPGAPGATSPVVAALGDPINVGDAIAVRDGEDHPGREMVVAGYLSPLPTLACPFIPGGAENPTHLVCPQTFQWLMARPEVVMSVGPGSTEGGPPKGPAFHASFALVDPPDVPIPGSGAVSPLPVVLVGHFHDRRAARCAAADTVACGETFIVDRIATVNGAQRMVTTERRLERFDDATKAPVVGTPTDLEADVERLVLAVAPDAIVESMLVVTIDQVIPLEPVLADNQVVPHIGNPATLMWIVNAVDVQDGVAVSRTFALMDGSNWFAEITADGTVMHERRTAVAGPSDGATRLTRSADPHAFDAAPDAILGIPVRDIATLERDRRAVLDDLGRDEIALRAWYVSPRPGVACPPSPEVGVAPPCDEARHWLLDRPDQLGIEPGQLRADPDHWPPVLNPLLPQDVPFDVGDTWVADQPAPQPVIVLGHFEDHRVRTYAGNLWFVVDALAWTRDRGSLPIDSLNRLTESATEDPASVLARIDAVVGRSAAATWTTVVDAAAFATIDPRTAEDAPEFTTGRPIWIVRRLVHDVWDGRTRLAVQWAYTADGGSRIWLTSQPDAPADLATTLDLANPDARTDVIRVFDYGVGVAEVRKTDGGRLAWQRIDDGRAGVDVARGSSEREVAIRWMSGTCDRDWQVRLQPRTGESGSITLELRTYDDYCPETSAARSLVLVFDHPVDLRAFHVEYNPSGG
jgi:hypothetical protein